MQNLDIPTIVLAVIALFVVFKLRSVLGMRADRDRQPGDPAAPLRGVNGAAAPVSGLATPANSNAARVAATPLAADRWKGVAEPGSALWSGLDAIAAVDKTFTAESFLGGARAAYEMIVNAFAAGDSATLRTLLAPEAFDNFDRAIKARAAAGHKMTTTLVALDASDIVAARLAGTTAQVSVRFAAKLASVTRDAAGAVVDGSPDTVASHLDIWTFARDARSRDPNWALTATEAVADA